MSGQRYSVTVDVGANISSARQALSELQRLFGKNFSQSGNKQMFNLFGGLEKALDELETKSSKAITSLAQQKELDNARKKVMDFFDAIQTESKKISSLGGTDFAKRLEGLGTQLSSAAKAWSTYQTSVKAAMKEQDSLTSKKDNLTTTLENQKKALADLQKELDKYVGRNNEISKARGAETKAKNESTAAQKDLTAAKSAETRARKQYEKYIAAEKLITDAQGKIDKKASKNNLGFIDSSVIATAKQYYNEIVKIQKALDNTKIDPANKIGLKKSLADKTTQYEDFLKANNLQKNALGGVDEAAASLFNKSISQKIEEAQNLYKQLEIKANEVKTKQKEFDSKEKIATGKTAEVTALEGKKSEIESKIADLQNAISKTEANLKQAQAAFDDFFKAGKDTAAFDKLKENLRNLFGDDFVKDMQNTEQGLENIKQKIESIGGDKIAQAKQDLESFNNSLSNGQLVNDLDKINNKFAQTGEQVLRAEQQVREIEHIKSRIQYFFGLANAINLVKRTIRSSFNTVKELDKAMTETAVVTDYTIKDMWKQLPEYTKRANQLGVTTKEAYESATLYYQQGLNTEQAAALSTETLKMARIAGLDAADATDRMTNALRGFNMELNATQAQRVDDVYSQLAAMSASNVDEISTAMTKVASLANNANMEFETTAAFLAQIIESTRESAETAGTALKTVVARFSEVKKLYDKEELKGQDEEGQVIDVNKVSAALRTAGIDLNKYFLGEVGLDDIFIELASKWDSLTNIQQRYIATQAAGSRQQSRFIALMADYARTQELVGAAYNSTGASQKQFEKTQDSMQSKLARLKNAWDEFAMGLANNAVLKGVVDALTLLLQVVNKVTSAFGDGVGSVLKWVTAISALSGVRKAFTGGGFIDKALGTVLNGTIFGKGLFEKGILSGFLFGGKHVEGSKAQEILQEQAANGGNKTTIRTGGLFSNLFGNLKKRRADRASQLDEYYKQRALENGLRNSRNFMNPGYQPTTPDYSNLEGVSGIAKLGLKVNNSKLLGGVSKKLAGTKFAGGLSKLLGFGSSGAGAAAAAGLATALGAVAAAAAAAYGAYKLWEHFSPEGQLKQATEFSKAMDQAAESAKKAKESTKEAYDTYIEKDKAINKATTITERNKAIEDRNTYVNELLQQNDSYAKYLKTTFKDGKLELTLDEKALKNVADEAEKAATQTAFGADLAKAMQANKQANVYRANIRRAGANTETGTIREQDENGFTYQRQMTNKELAKYTNLETRAAESDKIAEGFAKSAFSKMVDGKALGDELGELVANTLAKTFDKKEYYETANRSEGGRGFSWLRRRSVWKQKYLEAYGVEADSSMQTADIARAVAQKTAQNQEKERVDAFSKLVEADKEKYEPLLKAINGELDIETSGNTDEIVGNLIKGFSSEEIGQIEKALHIDSLTEILKGNVEIEKQIQQKHVSDLATIGLQFQLDENSLAKILTLPKQKIADILGFSDVAKNSLKDGFKGFLEEIPNLDDKEFKQVKELFSSYDLDSPIAAFKTLKKVASDSSNEASKYASKILNNYDKTLFDKGYLTQVFMTSEAYEGINESLDKFIEENGKITSENIIELAKSCSDLNTLIEEGKISAQALASVFTTYEQGKIQIEGITTSVLEALSKISSLDYEIEKMYTNISKFDPGKDFGEGIDFVISQLDNLKKYVDNLEFGNEVTQKIYDQIFGKGAFGNLKGTPQQIQEQANKEIERVRQLVENNSYGFMKKAAQEGALGIRFTEEGNTNNFTWDIGGKTTSDLIGNIQNYAKVSEDTARQILAGWLAQSSNTREILNNNDFKAGVNELANQYENQNVITEQEMQAFAAQFGKDISDIQNYADQNGINLPVVVSWQNKDGSTFTEDQLYNKFKEIKEKIEDNKIDAKINIGKDKEGKDYNYIDDPEGMVSHIQNAYKTTREQAKIIANKYAAENNAVFQKEIEVPTIEKDSGEIIYDKIKIKAKSIDDLNIKTDQINQNANYKLIADTIAKAIGSVKVGTEVNQESLGATKQAITDGLNGISVSIDVYGNWKGIKGGPSSNDNKTGESNPNDGFLPEAKGGIVSSYASGARHIKPGIALTGEEGPELVWNKEGGYAYLVGKHGPEFADLVPGDQVFPADETKNIIRRGVTPSLAKGGKVVPAYANEGTESNNQQGNGGYPEGADNGKKKKKKKETEGAKLDLDKYYNMVEDINELLRLRNLLEKDYEQLLKSEGKTGKEIYDNLSRQLKLLKQRQKIVEDLAQKRKQQIFDLLEENKQYANYAWWNDEDQTIEIDWDAIQQIKDKDTASALKEYLSKLEDFQGKYDDMIEQLEEIESNVQEIQKRGKDQYDTLEERVRDALIKQIKDKIDELTEVDRAISETNQKLFNSMQDTLEKQRQQRDNKKTEEDLTDKEKRLAYLQQDSSNANALEIAKLQKELDDARQDYTDNLIDQKISELQKQNDEAQEQRQEQIDLMQRSLDWQEKSGAFWETVYKYISEGTDEMGSLVHGSELETLLKSAEPWDKLSEEQRKTWVNELMGQVAQAIAYLELTRQLEDIGVKKGTEITFTTSGEKLAGALDENGEVELEDSNGKKFKGVQQEDGTVRFTDEDGNLVGYGIVNKEGEVEFKTAGQTLTGTVDKDGNVIVENPDGTTVTYKDVFQDYNGAYRTFETYVSPEKEETETEQSTGEDEGTEYVYHTIQYNDKQHEITRKVKGTSEWHHVKYENHSGNPCTKCGYKKESSTSSIPPLGGAYGGGGCFVAGTKIIMSNYIEKNIEDIRVGESVFAYDETLRIFEPKKVIKAYAHYNTPYIMTVILSNNLNIQLTPGHPILTTEGWKSRDIENSLYEHKVVAKLLKVGDEVIGYGKNVFIKEFIINDNINHVNVYNIEIEDLHTFVANKIVVHNSMKSVEDEFYGSTKSITKESAWVGNEGLSPNSILNARNTQNFVEFDDALANIYKNGGFSLKNGDNYYDITVNVEQMNSDYDVDRAIERIRTRIAQESAYRNVNTLSRLR